jgi:hypothetical protein
MKIGPRYLSKRTTFASLAVERAALLASLKAAPGIVAVESVEPHVKGGHRASLLVDRTMLDAFIAHMDAQGWMDGL